jgi:ribulose-phosphate 3-epimerase
MISRPLKIAPSLLAADFARLGDEVDAITCAGADWIHVDVMDGHFVPNLTMGPDVVRSITGYTSLPLDVHLMIDPVIPYIKPFVDAGVHHLMAHIEVKGVDEILKTIRTYGKKAGLALRPSTPAEALWPYLNDLSTVLVMTVEPGFGGQRFMEDQLEKIKTIRERIVQKNLDIDIVVDGGITLETAPKAVAAGANVLVAGTAIFKASASYEKTIEAFKALAPV